MHDQFALGRRFRILNIVDDVTRECLAAIPDTSISGRRVARELTALMDARGKPGMIVSDNETEFTSNAILAWAKDHRVEWHYIAAGRPMQNGYIESFNGRMRDELVNESLFIDLDQARQLISDWAADYNTARPHSSLARLQDPGSLCRYTHRAEGRNVGRDANHHWMKVQWQVRRTIPPKANRKDPICFSKHLYRARNLVERFFNKIKHFRRIATRYDKLAENYAAALKLVAVRIWIRDL